MIIAVNTRILSQPITGVQRYLISVLRHIPSNIEVLKIISKKKGVNGHLWEQIAAPSMTGKHLLWSPGNTGPLCVKNQIVTIHDTAVLEHSEWFNPQFAAWYRFLIPRLAARVRGIIAVSQYTKARISEICSIPENKIQVVLNGVGPEFTTTSKQQITFTKQSLGIPGVQYILALGTVEPRKNIDRLIRAWGQVVESIPNNIWLVVGGGNGPRRIFRSMQKYSLPPRVFFCGFVPNEMLPALYSGALISAYPSLYEGFGLPALEAMACGCPVLTSNTTALPEIVRDAAILVNPYDCEAIANGLLKLVIDEDLRVKLSRLGLKRAKNFSWKRSANETFDILREEALACL